jgi:Uma2 family endonuclease
MTAFVVNMKPTIDLDDEQFYQLCRQNPELKFERSAQGELIIMPPTGGESGRRNSNLTTDLNLWNRQMGLGVAFDSSTGFKLPNGSDRSPDAAWVELGRWQALTPEQREKFPPMAPDFVVELRSPTDNLAILQAKMREYLDNGVRLGLLINPQDKQVELYRLGQGGQVLAQLSQIDCGPELPGFVLSLTGIL